MAFRTKNNIIYIGFTFIFLNKIIPHARLLGLII